jgi:hypothetical protein
LPQSRGNLPSKSIEHHYPTQIRHHRRLRPWPSNDDGRASEGVQARGRQRAEEQGGRLTDGAVGAALETAS